MIFNVHFLVSPRLQKRIEEVAQGKIVEIGKNKVNSWPLLQQTLLPPKRLRIMLVYAAF